MHARRYRYETGVCVPYTLDRNGLYRVNSRELGTCRRSTEAIGEFLAVS